MAVPLAGVGSEKFAYNRFTTQCRECDRCYKLLAGRSDYDLNLCACLDEQAKKIDRFVGSNAARYAKYHMLAFQHC